MNLAAWVASLGMFRIVLRFPPPSSPLCGFPRNCSRRSLKMGHARSTCCTVWAAFPQRQFMSETLMHLQNLFGQGWCQLIHCLSMWVCLPVMFPQRIYCFPNSGFYCCSEKPLLNWSGGCCCSYGFSHPASMSMGLSPSCCFFCCLVSPFVPLNTTA
ncbi:uncharacterized protein EURHEDRAFT_339707 [Aspergillus ruber CBS 135680]|uniref:Secreted protein n=1 Tax=Aspergillus ruber (strain CBS 135680) TaxID=1388766 RepID=A0A017SIM7_ASPRC|nr:uncharacterized protein EURHEDRAFT_339707 [Aspergillus ruber CBS 135680]EYE96813.1 hypothetical protein EURHEDRAFT_339707 [Aspergillus ruber CBS 135680]